MSKRRGGFWTPTRESIVEEWLREQGVLCDCDNGWRPNPSNASASPSNLPPIRCDRCVLVEVKGGIRVRATSHRAKGGVLTHVMLPAVEVTDERT